DDGTQSRTSTVTRLDAGMDIPDGVFLPSAVGEAVPASETQAKAVDPSLVSFPVWRLPTDTGFKVDGALVKLSTGLVGDQAGITMLYRRDADLIEVEQELQGGLQLPDTSTGVTATVPGLGDGRLVVGLSGPALVFPSLKTEGAPRQVVPRSQLSPSAVPETAAPHQNT